jgi:CBS-domain-containing membrane protein
MDDIYNRGRKRKYNLRRKTKEAPMKANTANLKMEIIEAAAKAVANNLDFSRDNLNELIRRFENEASEAQIEEMNLRLERI